MSNDLDTIAPAAGRRLSKAAVIGGVAVLAVIVAGIVWFTRGDETVPYDDPQSSGLLTLCDTSGHQVTGGKITDKPFAPIVLGQTPLDKRVAADVVPIATLYGYQPRPGVEALEFSGTAIGGPVPFTRHDKPATQVVKEAYSIANFTEIYPAKLDGYVQLRLITSAPGFGAFTTAYDTADLKVDGDNWKLVRGGNASCAGASSLVGNG